ncbi:MAG: multiphosphoryl transfer protein [Solirubrobacteraceae bacterium]|nr:multiphosphoryl transfer protein [Solirubrobacteraceae bacterium]
MSVGLVIVSHSARIAEGVVELARQMGGEDVAIEAAGGMADPPGEIGTDPELIMAAIERASSEDGVLVLMDLGSALMSADMAVEMGPGDTRVLLGDAALVEGAVAAAAAARGGLTLDEVAAEARGALRAKVAELGGDEDGHGAVGPVAPGPDAGAGPPPDEGAAEELRLRVENRLGFHARPVAALMDAARGADVEVENLTAGRGPASARSHTSLSLLGVRRGHEIVVRVRGAGADRTLAAIQALADANWGDPVEDGAAPAAEPDERPAGGPAEPAEPPDVAAGVPAPAPGDVLRGLPVAPGIGIGRVRHLRAPDPVVPDDPPGDPGDEWARLGRARDAARADLRAARATVAAGAGEGEAAIFDAHLLLLDDAALLDPARRALDEEGRNAAQAWDSAVRWGADAYRAMDDPYLRERAADVLDVGRRVLGHLTGAGGGTAALDGPGVLVAADLTPGETAALDRDLVRGIATARGSATSHAAILARALGIPAVVGLGAALLQVADATPLVLDGEAGTVAVDPGADALEAAERRRAESERVAVERRARAAAPAMTRDGRRVEVAANLGAVAEAAGAVEQGAEGVGLLRTEFLFLGREDAPGEEEQVEALRGIAEALDGRPLVVRTLDVGADKPIPFLAQEHEANPFLGRRGIRLALAFPEVMRTQLRAIVRVASEYPSLKVMFPMVASLSEVRAARAMLDEVRAELGLDPPLEVGVMVEVPAVAVAAERFAREVDFFSIGTNDLAQYALAAERGNEHVAALAAGPVPEVLALVDLVVRGARAHGRWVGVCGELAGDPLAAAQLVGLGVEELSMAAPRIPDVKEALRAVDSVEAARVAREALEADDADAVRHLAAGLLGAG